MGMFTLKRNFENISYRLNKILSQYFYNFEPPAQIEDTTKDDIYSIYNLNILKLNNTLIFKLHSYMTYGTYGNTISIEVYNKEGDNIVEKYDVNESNLEKTLNKILNQKFNFRIIENN